MIKAPVKIDVLMEELGNVLSAFEENELNRKDREILSFHIVTQFIPRKIHNGD